jgi:hypothetical protein
LLYTKTQNQNVDALLSLTRAAPDSFRTVKLWFEIGECYLSQSKNAEGLECIERGECLLRQLFGDKHPLYQRYYYFIMLHDSITQNKEGLLSHSKA